MLEVKLKYNPYTKEKKLEIGGIIQEETMVRNICGSDEKDIADWSMDFYKNILEKENDGFTLYFTGIQRDYEIMDDSLKKFLESNKENNNNIQIEIKEDKIIPVKDQLTKLKQLFKKMQEESPFDELKAEKLKKIFEKATNSEFEMAIIATVSSGKSTLINSMLGQELLPVANEATTATIASIHQNNELKNFYGISYTKDGKKNEYDNISIKEMETLNNDSNVSKIEIYGPISGIETNDIKLVLTDSPGPNNSRNLEHREYTMNLLNEDYKPMVIYVLNGTQLEVNDDETLLKIISDKMKGIERQNRDRFLFVLNKADVFDPEKKEKIAKKIDDVKEYLKKFGINNPRVFPTTAQLAKIIRQYMKNQELTKKEKSDMNKDVEYTIETVDHHFCEYADFLSQETINKHKEKINEIERSDDNYKKALFYTGIPSLEMAISEYLLKYAIPAKVYKGVNSFKEKIEKLNIEAKITKKLEGDAKQLNEVIGSLEKIENIIDNGKAFSKLKKEIENINLDKKKLNDLISDSSSLFISDCTPIIQEIKRKDIPYNEFKRNIEKIKTKIDDNMSNFQSEINKASKSHFEDQIKKYIDSYKKYVEDIIGENKYKTPKDFFVGTSSTVSISEIFEDYTEYIKEKTVNKSVKNPARKGFWGWFKIWEPKTIEVKKQINVVDGEEFINELYPKINQFEKTTRNIATEGVKDQMKQFREYFLDKIQDLNKIIGKKIKEKKEKLKDKNKFSEMIKQNEKNLDWLRIFKEDLDSILNI